MAWDRAAFGDVRDSRFTALVERLGRRAALRENPPATCLAFGLPADYATFLAGLSKPSRRATQRLLKLQAERPALRFTALPPGAAAPAGPAPAGPGGDAAADPVWTITWRRWWGSTPTASARPRCAATG